MVIWSGKGFLIAVFVILGAIIGMPLGDATNNDAIGVGTTLIVAGLINILLTRFINSRKPKIYIDAETGEEIVMNDGSSLFFIPVKYWTYILVIAGVLYIVAFGLLKL